MPRSPIAERNELARRLCAEGVTHYEIGKRLYISASTVKGICRGVVRDPKPGEHQWKCRRCRQDVAPLVELCLTCIHDTHVGPAIEKPPAPTKALPGTTLKVEELKRRIEQGESLWHDDDNCDYEGQVGGVKPAVGHPGSGMGKRLLSQICTTDTHIIRKAIS